MYYTNGYIKDSVSSATNVIDCYDYDKSEVTNHIKVRFECGRRIFGTLPEAQRYIHETDDKNSVVMVINGIKIVL